MTGQALLTDMYTYSGLTVMVRELCRSRVFTCAFMDFSNPVVINQQSLL